MAEAWRIVREKHAPTAFSGEGAAKYGGRWNSRGVPVVYASSTQSLAALETLVHLSPLMGFRFVIFRIVFSDTLIELLPSSKLPEDWRIEPPPPSTKRVGDTWVREARSVVLALPSAIIPSEYNLLINPAHADFKKLSVGEPETFVFDPRLLT